MKAPLRRSWILLAAADVLLLAPLFLSALQLFIPIPSVSIAAAAELAGPNQDYGIAHISYGHGSFSPERYQVAQEAGVSWNRWVFYWNEIETAPGVYEYTEQDATVDADRANGFHILGILLGTPPWAGTAGLGGGAAPPLVGQRAYTPSQQRLAEAAGSPSTLTSPPRGLYLPIFTDGTDAPGPRKTINPSNVWARFVFNTASRYKGRVEAWEIWNEPDFRPTAATGWYGFWNGDEESYARLLKVAYLTIKLADPNATVVMGGMAYWHQQDFFPRLLAALQRDPDGERADYFFDATAWHWYSRPKQILDRTLWIKAELAQVFLPRKPIWITETNLPVCDDAGVAPWFPCSAGSHRGSIEHQAAYIIQALSYARVAGVEKVFVFQLYDDELGPGEYFGLVRNTGEKRPALDALKVATRYFRDIELAYHTTSNNGRIELVTMLKRNGERVRIIWDQTNAGLAVRLPIDSSAPTHVQLDGVSQLLPAPVDRLLPLILPPATLNDGTGGFTDFIVGGRPLLIVEPEIRIERGVLEGEVQDGSARPLAGIPVQVGDARVTSDPNGRYKVQALPGLYDVRVRPNSPFPALAPPGLSVPVWTGKSTAKNLSVHAPHQRFLPILPRRSDPGSP